MRAYHFVSAQYGLDDLARRRLKVALIDDLNDPFDLRAFGSANPRVRSAFEAMRSQLATTTGILCFSRRWSNPVQWSHYADRHRGICLGFDVPDHLVTPVIYSSRRVEPDLATIISRDAAAITHMQNGLTTKYSHWRYEKEVRAIVRLEDQDKETGHYFADFSDDLRLREVIVGPMSSLTRLELSDALRELEGEVITIKARIAFRSFKVVKQRNRRLWE